MTNANGLRFAVDANVGRLAKWLRIMGYDAVYLPHVDDNDLVRLALKEGRVVLTRDRGFAVRRLAATGALKVLMVTSDDLWEQVRQVADAFNLERRAALVRCIECNEPLVPISKQEAADRVPPYVRQTQEEFMTCPACGKVYWKGTHWRNMQAELERAQEGRS